MVYNSGPEGINDVRIATGNLLPEDYPDTQITKRLKAAYAKIQLANKRLSNNPFEEFSVDAEYARQIELNLAAMWCLKAYGPEFLDKIDELKDEVKEDLEILVTGTESTTNEIIDEGEIMSTSMAGWYVNTNVMVPNRMKPFSTNNTIEGVPRIDPELNL